MMASGTLSFFMFSGNALGRNAHTYHRKQNQTYQIFTHSLFSVFIVHIIYTVEGIKKLSKTTTFFKIYRKNIQRLLVFHKAIG